jgi:hypothetical protein
MLEVPLQIHSAIVTVLRTHFHISGATSKLSSVVQVTTVQPSFTSDYPAIR